ncbi:polysaccharide biosynthesis tyrosine autokinase [Litoribacter alkaliphilus]|uniref:non-specific protein-tyrosine kinase n=1 Tax=Litoribacter ruber TaxID=702568 RepID=A0AAP2G4Q6_9BACT|nr:polysaccharide biosynthesis tyrosine autokinase [Litoribacter alkaliphilus]MBS9524271.1 polysaccharide biosynthesis tyrosine autokinase [Litoribacter alkaliphilus]
METKSENINLKGLVVKYLRYWPFLVVSVMIAVVLAHFKTKMTEPLYKVDAKFMILDEQRSNMVLDLTGMGAAAGRSMGPNVINETFVLRSRPLAYETLKSLDFDVEYYERGSFVNKEVYKRTPIIAEVDWSKPQVTGGEILVSWVNDKEFTIEFLDEEYKYVIPDEEDSEIMETPILKNNTFTFGQWVELPYSRFKVDKVGSESEGEMIVKFKDIGSLVGRFTGEDLQVTQVDDMASVVDIALITNHPQKGKDYLNKLMEKFLDQELEQKNRMAGNTVAFIDSQISGVADSLSRVESQMGQYRSANRTYDMTQEGGALFGQLSELEQSAAREKFKRDYYKRLENYLVREEYNEIVVPSGAGIEDPILNSLIENLITLQSEKSRLLATQTEASPAVREVTRKIRDLNASLKEVLRNVDSNAEMLIRDLEARIAKIEGSFSRLPETEQNLLKMRREFALNEGIYNFLLQRRAEAAISKASNTASSKIIEKAVPNNIAIAPKPMQNYMVGVLLGLLFPIAIITIKDFFNNKINDIRELEKQLHLPVMARIGNNKRNTNLVVLKENREPVTEAFRSLRSNITYAFSKDKQMTIMLTSSISGEGKTFCAMNLASVYSLSGKKTILVGCDLRKPKIFADFGLTNKKGLSTYLSEQVNKVEDVIQPTKFKNLDILTSGPIPPNPSELISDDRFSDMVNDLKTKYDVVILDTPPIGLASETLELLKLVDLTFYVFRYNYSQKVFIEHANALKSRKNIKNFYAIFNGISEKEMQYGGYGYGYYAEPEKPGLFKRVFGGMRKNAAI